MNGGINKTKEEFSVTLNEDLTLHYLIKQAAKKFDGKHDPSNAKIYNKSGINLFNDDL